MYKFLDVKYVNKINLLFCFLYVLPMVFLIIYSSLNKEIFSAKVLDIKSFNKYKYQITSIKLSNNKSIEYKFLFNFFDQNQFVDLNKQDVISYSIVKKSLVEIENKRNNHKLNTIYFVLSDYYGYFIFLIVLSGIYNMITYLNFKELSTIYKLKNTDTNRLDKFNNWTKKNPIPTFLAFGIIVYLLYNLKEFIKSKQEFLEVFFIYKYVILYIPLLIIMPYLILNFKNYSIFKQKNLLH